MKTRTKLLVAASAFAIAATAGAAQAQTVAALVDGDTLAHVDAKSRKVTKTVKIEGVGALVGIDVRPADKMLYGLAEDGTIVIIDPQSGKATMKSKIDVKPAAGTMVTVDFNPAADRLRVMSNDGMNLRINVDDGKVITDGKLAFADKDMHKGEKPNIVAGAYTNSVGKPKTTTLYDIDATIGGLIRQAPPNDGILNAVGKLGVKATSWSFDIAAASEGKNSAWLMGDDTLYSVNLESGKATAAGKVTGLPGKVMDIAILP